MPADERLAYLRSLTYDEYLQTDHWQRVRYAAIRAAGEKCAQCGLRTADLDVHHVGGKYPRGREAPEDVVALCRSCHRRLHPGWVDKRASTEQKLRREAERATVLAETGHSDGAEAESEDPYHDWWLEHMDEWPDNWPSGR